MPERHIYKNKLQQIDEVNHSPLTPLWKVLLIELISRQNTQAGSENGGLSWPGLDRWELVSNVVESTFQDMS